MQSTQKILLMLKKWHLLILLVIGGYLLTRQIIRRSNSLKSNGITDIAHVYDIQRNVSTGKISRRDLVHLEFYFNQKKITIKKEVLNKAIKVNHCYEIIFDSTNLKIADVFFGREKECPSFFIE